MKKHSEIVPVYSKLCADFVLVALLEKNCLQQAAVPLIEAIQSRRTTLRVSSRSPYSGHLAGLDKPLCGLIFQCFNPGLNCGTAPSKRCCRWS